LSLNKLPLRKIWGVKLYQPLAGLSASGGFISLSRIHQPLADLSVSGGMNPAPCQENYNKEVFK